MSSGLSAQRAFEISIEKIGQPEILKSEFKKNERAPMKRIGIFAMLIGAVIILRIVTERPDAEHLRENEQLVWMVTGSAIVLFGLNTVTFIKLGEARDVRIWKLVGISYSIFAAWISMMPILVFLTVPKFSAAVGMTDRTLTFAAVTVSFLSALGWRWTRGFLPIIQSRRIRTTIGVAGCVLGPVTMALFWFVIAPQLKYFAVVPATWVCTLTAILGGVGYGLAEAAHTQTRMSGFMKSKEQNV
jgi:membrane-associated HD superfamily phosphohydrolase